MNIIAWRINVCADDWTTERAIIASNVVPLEVFRFLCT